MSESRAKLSGGRWSPANAAHPGDRFGLVFTLLLVSFVATALLSERPARIVTTLLYFGALVLAMRLAPFSPRTTRRLRWGLLAASAIVALLTALLSGRVIEGVAAFWVAGILSFTVSMIVVRVLHHRVVTMQTIFGALSAYLLVGFIFTALFTATARLMNAQFFTGGEQPTSTTIQYFSFITLTTTGYGDLTPAGQPGRSLAVLCALSGQIFLVTLVARLVSVLGTQRNLPGD